MKNKLVWSLIVIIIGALVACDVVLVLEKLWADLISSLISQGYVIFMGFKLAYYRTLIKKQADLLNDYRLYTKLLEGE